MKKISIFTSIGLTFPVLASAQTFFEILTAIDSVVARLVPVVLSLGILLFFWGLARYIIQTDTVEGKAAAKSIMIWGVVTIFIMVSLWGIVNFLQLLSGTTGAPSPTWPQL